MQAVSEINKSDAFKTLYKQLEMPSRINTITRNYLMNAGKFLAKQQENSPETIIRAVEDFKLDDPFSFAAEPKTRATKFYYYLKEKRPSPNDLDLARLYSIVTERYENFIAPEACKFTGLHHVTKTMLAELLKGAGNEWDVCVYHWIRAACDTALNFQPNIINNPKAVFGIWGWQQYIKWIVQEYGSLKAYRKPTKEEEEADLKFRAFLRKVTLVSLKYRNEGNLEMYKLLKKSLYDGTIHDVLEKHGINLEELTNDDTHSDY